MTAAASSLPVGPLHGYRVVEFCTTLAGPLATMLMADQGADVIKVETPAGDQGRQVGHAREGVAGISTMFINTNRNKRSIVLDLKNAGDVELAIKLAASADIVVQSFRPGVMDRLGLGYEAIRSRRADVIYVSISGLGEDGPGRDRRVYDVVVQGLAGFAAVQADRETGEPRTVQNAVCDKVAALVVWQAATAALLHRERTGQGQHVKVNMLQAALSFLWPESIASATLVGEGVRAGGSLAGVRYIHATSDGHIVVAYVSNEEFASCCRALGIPELIADPRFDTIANRFANAPALNALIARCVAGQPSAHWLARLAAEDAVYAPVNGAGDLWSDPHVTMVGALAEHTHPVYGTYRQPTHPIGFSASPASHRRDAPLLGEHTEEIRAEIEERPRR
jgi:crotonobetainyl-CoA:carnitine CoA-transferase CaiB-like acyl-CoA transferase